MKKKVLILGSDGLVGRELVEEYSSAEAVESYDCIAARRSDADLCELKEIRVLLNKLSPNIVLIAAAKVGGIFANASQPVEFLDENLRISLNVLKASFEQNIEQVLVLGSSCIYPKYAKQPIGEEQLLSGFLEPTNEAYAIAKIAAIKACQSYNRQYGCDFRAVMPTNLFGINDQFYSDQSHVIPALISRFIKAKANGSDTVTIWGTGAPLREFMSAKDMASACRFIMEMPKKKFNEISSDLSFLNVGSGDEISIKDLAGLIAKLSKFDGKIEFDISKPDGTPRKLLCSKRLRSAGWHPKHSLSDGILEIIEKLNAQ